MPNPSTQHALARRALIEDIRANRKGWLQHGLAALAVSVLGLGVAGSVVFTGAAQQTAPRPAEGAPDSGVVAGAGGDAATGPQASAAKIQSLADQRAEELSKADDDIDEAAQDEAADARQQLLASASKATQKQAVKLAEERNAPRKAAARVAPEKAASPKVAKAKAESDSRKRSTATSCTPVAGGYRVAARFGQVGSWSRYHTGNDYSAPVGTPLKAPAAGVVTNAGVGPASGWAGNYVAIKYPDGTQSLMAHMSTVSVSVGQTVSPCQVVGAIGMTGRTFGPHVHFEIYPAGVVPGDVYRAVNPSAWLSARNLRP